MKTFILIMFYFALWITVITSLIANADTALEYTYSGESFIVVVKTNEFDKAVRTGASQCLSHVKRKYLVKDDDDRIDMISACVNPKVHRTTK